MLERVAVVIGIDYKPLSSRAKEGYPATLHFAEADATEIATRLEREGGFLVKRLIGKEATRKAIIDAVNKQSSAASGQGDLLIIYFAGHGALDPHDTDTAYLIPSGIKVEDLRSMGITFSQLMQFASRAYNALVVLDCCHGGAALSDRGTAVLANKAYEFGQRVTNKLTAQGGLYVLSACAAGEQARENAKLGHGAFTYYILEYWDTNPDEVNEALLFSHVDRVLEQEGYHRPVHGGKFTGRVVLRSAPHWASIDRRPHYRKGITFQADTPIKEVASHLYEWKSIHTSVQSLFINIMSLRRRYMEGNQLSAMSTNNMEADWIDECIPKIRRLVSVCNELEFVKHNTIDGLRGALVRRPTVLDLIRVYESDNSESLTKLKESLFELQVMLAEALELADCAIIDIAENIKVKVM